MKKGSDVCILSTISINRHEKMGAFKSKSLPTNSNTRWLLSKPHYYINYNYNYYFSPSILRFLYIRKGKQMHLRLKCNFIMKIL